MGDTLFLITSSILLIALATNSCLEGSNLLAAATTVKVIRILKFLLGKAKKEKG
jgi:hypothetical protein